MATSTISNTLEDPSGGDVEGIAVTVTLMPTAGFRVSDAVEVARTVSTTTDVNGAWSLALERNSNITPANTYYRVVEEIPASQGGRRTWNIQVGASNQTVSAALVTPLPDVTTSNFLTQASADARYQALSAIGSDTPSTIDPDDAAAAGASTAASRGDHVHGIVAGTPVDVAAVAAEGVAATFSRGDHVHPVGAWAAWTPTLVNMTLGNGTVSARFTRVGNTVRYRFRFTLGSTSAVITDATFTLPATPASTYATSVSQGDTLGTVRIKDTGTADYIGQAIHSASGVAKPLVVRADLSDAALEGLSTTNPMTWTTNDVLMVDGEYEAA